MSSKAKKTGKKGTQYYSSRSETSKNLFHKPQAYGELLKIPMTKGMTAVSVISIVSQAGLSIFCIYAFLNSDSIAALEEGGFSGSFIYLIFPIFTWLFTLICRFLCATVPLDMWRMPKKVRSGVVISEGKTLKTAALLVELATSVFFIILSVILFAGRTPSMIPIILWIAALVLCVYLPFKKAADLAKEEARKAAAAKAEKARRKAAAHSKK